MKYIFALINLFLLAASAYFCTQIVYKTVLKDAQVIPEIKDSDLKQAEVLQEPARKGMDLKHIETIVQRNIFKVETEKKAGSEKNPAEENKKLEPTTLSLTLWGTVTGGPSLYAVIEDKKSRLQALYQEGDTIQEAKIKKIQKREVILTFQGKDQILEMESDPNKAGPPGKPPPVHPASAEDTIRPVQPQQPPNNTGRSMTKFKLRPFFTKGSPDGVMIYGIKPDSAFNRAGLRNGDIVKSINGTVISSVEDATSLLSDLENSENASLSLVRGGETKEISYSAGSNGQPPVNEPAPVAPAVPEEIKEEKLPDPMPQDNAEIITHEPEDQEPEKTEISEDQN